MSHLSDVIDNFKALLQKYPDDQKYTMKFYSFFKTVHFSNVDYIPYLEMGTILKYEKPNIFYDLKKSFNRNFIIEVVTNSTLDLDEAIKRIERISAKKVH